ncbi:MAG: plasmid stabilization system protein ParE [Brevundimonas sp.]|uniref:type II toxin-antitoxin system RelE/ParE family toxin n=1 Tax=Brevundimonas sp. TaxID=1871086 RepID=UPI002488FD88|nr:type II toxin-antitoxin system RelE/ParE family toxin [Brevundimonas sp.]MDI1280509.1 type II toxin-antitoxin system RelE/ParE family toxin [Brevundimonas sp.]
MPSPGPLDLLYRREALRDLDNLFDFIAMERPLAAERFLLEIKRSCEGLRWFPFVGRQIDPNDDRVRVLSVRRRAAIKYVVTATTVHILAVSYRGRDLSAFFAGRR